MGDISEDEMQKPLWRNKRWWVLIGVPLFLFFYIHGNALFPKSISEETRKNFALAVGVRPAALPIRYRLALSKFPNADTCLQKGVPSEPQALRKANWRRIKNTSQFEVCIFHFATIFEDYLVLADWLHANGLETHTIAAGKSNGHKDRVHLADIINIPSIGLYYAPIYRLVSARRGGDIFYNDSGDPVKIITSFSIL